MHENNPRRTALTREQPSRKPEAVPPAGKGHFLVRDPEAPGIFVIGQDIRLGKVIRYIGADSEIPEEQKIK
jgi:hypothetical protein